MYMYINRTAVCGGEKDARITPRYIRYPVSGKVVHSFIHVSNHSFIHSFIRSFIHSFGHCKKIALYVHKQFLLSFYLPSFTQMSALYRDITILKICSKINNNNDNKDSIINLYFCLLLFFLNPPNILRTT